MNYLRSVSQDEVKSALAMVLNTAIPGTPTADSVNAVLQTLKEKFPDDRILGEFESFGRTVIASDILLHTNDEEAATTATSYMKAKEIHVPYSGEFRVKFDIRDSNGTGTSLAQIWKNGVAYGTARGTTSTSFQTFSEDLEFEEDDLLQLYHRRGSNVCYVRNLRIYGSLTNDFENIMT